MQRIASALTATAIAVASLAGPLPAQAASPHRLPEIGQRAEAKVETVRHRRWRHRHRGPHFSFGFGVPLAYPFLYSQPYVYDRPYAYDPYGYDPYYDERPYVRERPYVSDDRCGDGLYYRYPVGCVPY